MSDRGTWKISIGGSTFADYADVLKQDAVAGGHHWQDFPGYGAAAESHIDLGNRKIARKMSVHKIHSTNGDAADWFMTGALAFEGVADVIIYHRDNAGTESNWTIANAKVEVTVEEPINVSTTTHLTITGGAAVKAT